MADVEETEELDPGEVEDLDVVPDDLEADLEVDEPELDEELSADSSDTEEGDSGDTAAAVPAAPAKAAKGEGRKAGNEDDDEEEDDDDEEDDVEADLDTILKDRIAAPPDEEDEEDTDAVVQVETDDRTDGSGKIQPRKPDEFVCQSCFLVKHPSQLADPDHQLCADCV